MTGRKDAGNRSAVTGGKHLDGFIDLLADVLADCGLPGAAIHSQATTLPGWFRPSKNWDLVVVDNGHLLASIEFKAHVGPSFGNNFNNRVEEALGNSTDLLTAYREGKFAPSQRPWLGWLMLLEDSPRSLAPVRVAEPHYAVFAEFKDTSYAQRYALFCERLMRECLYDSACLLLSEPVAGLQGVYREPNAEIGFRSFLTSLTGRFWPTQGFRPDPSGKGLVTRQAALCDRFEPAAVRAGPQTKRCIATMGSGDGVTAALKHSQVRVATPVFIPTSTVQAPVGLPTTAPAVA